MPSIYYKRMLYMLKDIEQDPGSLKKHIQAIEVEVEEEDIAHDEKKLKAVL